MRGFNFYRIGRLYRAAVPQSLPAAHTRESVFVVFFVNVEDRICAHTNAAVIEV